MSRPPKPYLVLQAEGKSNKTKAELKQRKEAEESVLTGTILKERPEVKNNLVAHKEFLRIIKLLNKIEKNDGIYEAVINRYCLLQAECVEFENKREKIYRLMFELESSYQEASENMDALEKGSFLLQMSKEINKLSGTMINLDRQIQTKRRMLLDIEKENVMTIAAALRSIPKEVKTEENPILKALQA